MSTNGFRRAGVVVGVAAATGAVLLLGSGVASAHVTAKVIGETAAQGGYTKITFRVPNEDEKAGTVKLEVSFPQDTPLSGARTKPMPGWTSTVTMAKLAKPVEVNNADVTEAVSKVTWTAQPGTRIAPGQFQEFEVSAGPLPEADELVMPATQTYDNKEVVAWDTPAKEGEEEPEHPAPAIALARPRRAATTTAAARPRPATTRRPPRATTSRPRPPSRRPATTPHAGSAAPAWSSARSGSVSAPAPPCAPAGR